MSIRIIEGFESEGGISGNWGVWGAQANQSYVVHDTGGTRRSGLYSIRAGYNQVNSTTPTLQTYSSGFYKDFEDMTKMTVGFALKQNYETFTYSTEQPIFLIGTNDGKYLYFIRNNSDQKLRIYNVGANQYTKGSLITTLDNVQLGHSTQYYFQIQVTIIDSTNSRIILKLGNQTYYDVTGLNIPTNNYRLNRIGWINICGYAQATPPYTQVDDIYMCDGTAPMNNFIGICSVIGSRPEADGDVTTMKASTGSRQSCIDELTADGNDYIYGDDTNQQYLAVMQDVSNAGTIKGIRVHFLIARSEAGSGIGWGQLVFRDVSDVEYFDTTRSAYYTGQNWHYTYQENCPIDGSAQTNTLINNLQLGMKVTQIE